MILALGGLCASLPAEEKAAEKPTKITLGPVSAEAFSGIPFGVGRLKIEAKTGRFQILPDRPWCAVREADGRAHYPIFLVSDGENDYWSRADRQHRAGILEAMFLFRGKEPLKLTWTLPDGQTVETTITPQPDNGKRKEQLAAWWRQYTTAVKKLVEIDAYPPQIESYLVSMLSQRLELTPPDLTNPWSGRNDVDTAFGLLLGAESIRVAMQRDTVLKHTQRSELANQPLPEAVTPPAITLPTFDRTQVTTEAIASHVPAECFYVRCGNFKNFQWLRSNLTQWGAMARDLTALRGWDYGIREKLEQQLALKETVLSKLFGDTLISDVAVIGSDTFVRAGASCGVLFEARNSSLLKIQLDRLRQDAKAANPAARETTVKISGRDVAFLSTPDNRIRSYYAIDGDYHLVSTSREIVRRFYEAGQGQGSLAKLDEFLYARHLMPTSRNDACFAYLSDPFFRQLVGPKYRVEMTRRTQAVAEIELVHLAQLAAKAEGTDHETIPQLIAGNFLPKNFPTRPDGSRTVMENGQVFDSLRGARGSFLPVADVDVEKITESELAGYRSFSAFYRREWERMDPAILAIKRHPAAKGRERISLDVHVTPYARRHYQSLSRNLGSPSPWKLLPLPGDLAQLSINFGAGAGFLRNQFGFAGVRDLREGEAEFKIANGRVFETVTPPVYYALHANLEANAEPTDQKPAPKQPDQVDLSDLTIFFYPYDAENQEEIRKSLKLQKQEQPVQLRLWINRLAKTRVAKIINAHAYLRARRASAGNVRFLHALSEQLQVEPNRALEVAEAVLGAEPVCRLGGRYQLTQDNRGQTAWQSTAWEHPSYHLVETVPPSFSFPLLESFHEAELGFNIDQTTLSTHLELELDAAAP